MHKANTVTGHLRSAMLLGAAAIASIGAAQAQDTGGDLVETVVVTGTSIRGVAPVGSNVVAVDRAQIEATGAQTMQQLYTSLPLIASFGVSSKPSEGITGIESSPTIHNFGESSSASTLLLQNGRPIMPQGSLGVGDPSVIPSIAIQRVDVMPDGDSAVYGSSAVAGVVNFITRKDFEGVNTQASFGRADQYNRTSLGLLAGKSWEGGNVTFAYEYQSNSSLTQNARAFGNSADLRSMGGANFNTLNCAPASIAANSGANTNIYLYPYTSPTIGSSASTSAAGTAPCDQSKYMEYFPSRTTNNTYLDVRQKIGPVNVDFETGFLYRTSMNKGPAASSVGNAGSLTGTAFGPGGTGSPALGVGSINPFYQGSAATGTAASEFIRWDPSQLLGTEVQISKQGSIDAYENVYLTTNLMWGWEAELDQSASTNNDFTQTDHGYCASCALLALNGTVNSGGTANTTTANTAVVDPFGLGNVVSVTRVLNTSNALDVWNPAATNRTSAQVLKEIMSDQTSNTIRITYNDVKLKFDGPLFDLPAGPIKAAMGVEYNQVNYYTAASSSNNTGSSQTGGANLNQSLPQNVKSAFLEFFIPAISPDMNIPLVQKLDFQVAGRVDDYSTTGTTRNPKLGFNWQIIDGLKMRGSYGTSFTAPNVTFVKGIGTIAANTTGFTIPPSHVNYAGSFCTNTAIVGTAGCNVGATFPGVTIGGPNPDLKPMTGRSYSAGIDFQAGDLWRPLEGLSGSVTYWKTFFYDGITLASNIGAGYLTVPQLEPLLELAPASGPWTTASPNIAAYIQANKSTSTLPQNIYFVAHQIRVNGFTIIGDGLDISVNYDLPTDNWGEFNWGYDATWKFDWWEKGGPHQAPGSYTSYLNGRFNTSVIFAEALEGRMHLGWALDPIIATLFWNYTAPYWVQTSTGPYANSPDGRPTGVPAALYSGGYQRVQANSTFDLNVDYKLPNNWLDGWTNGTTLSLNVRDLFATRPPFFNFAGTCNGSTFCNSLDEFNGDPLQRVISFSLRKSF